MNYSILSNYYYLLDLAIFSPLIGSTDRYSNGLPLNRFASLTEISGLTTR